MRSLIVILLITCLVSACSHLPLTQGVVFFDSNGNVYNSDTVGENLHKEFKLTEKPFVIFVISKSESDLGFKSQIQILNNVNPERFSYLLVTGSLDYVDKSGYYIKENGIESFISKDDFRIEIYDGSGGLVVSSDELINEDSVKLYLTKTSSGH